MAILVIYSHAIPVVTAQNGGEILVDLTAADYSFGNLAVVAFFIISGFLVSASYVAHIGAIYFCPHHPDFTGHCRWRKPEPGMLEAAIREFDLDPAQCVLFGDQPWDIQAGKECGVKSFQTQGSK